MVNVVATGVELQQRIEAAVARHNDRVSQFNELPKEIQAQFDTQLFDDFELLTQYINALTATLAEATKGKGANGGNTFEF
jgi:hypothetical protein